MFKDSENLLSNCVLIFVLAAIIVTLAYIIWFTPVFLEYDDYYHMAVSSFMKKQGILHEFRWAQFSILKDHFADKDFLFHVFILPFLSLSSNPVTAGKYALVCYEIIFLIALVYVLKKYVPSFIAAFLLLLPFLSYYFFMGFLYLRPQTMAVAFTFLAVYFLLNKRWASAFIISFLYSLTHVSFFMVLVFAAMIELLRYILHKEFFFKNIVFVAVGMVLGCLVHPNFPHNFTLVYVHAVLITFYSLAGSVIDFGSEFSSSLFRVIFISNFAVFLSLNAIVWIMLFSKPKQSLSTAAWWGCLSAYLLLSFLMNKYWLFANALCVVFLASFLNDWIGQREWQLQAKKIYAGVGVYTLAALLCFPSVCVSLRKDIEQRVKVTLHYEAVARWMQKNIPPQETIYHAYWSDSPMFLCFNPKNNYIVMLDPILMYLANRDNYVLYKRIREGLVSNPWDALREVFGVRYGYARKNTGLFLRIKANPEHFEILYEDPFGIVFKLV